MKRALSLLLVFVLCFGLCACSNQTKNVEKSKYIGQYKSVDMQYYVPMDNFYFYREMTLNEDGTGTLEAVVTSAGKYVKTGAIVEKGDVSWSDSDGYLVITCTITSYVNNNNGSYYTLDSESKVQTTKTFELKGNLLMDVATGAQGYTKVK